MIAEEKQGQNLSDSEQLGALLKNKASGVMVIRENLLFISQGGHPGFVFAAGFCNRSEHPDPAVHQQQLSWPYPFFLPPL